jgi:DNA-binding transcriptional MerR regulator
MVQMVKQSASGEFDAALALAREYLEQLKKEQKNARESIEIVKKMLSGEETNQTHFLKRKEAACYLHISMDTLRNWEMNGLLTVKRRQNGYRVYTDEDIQRLKIIRALRCANYSLEAILRMLSKLSENPQSDIQYILNTPTADAEIISVCDKLLFSLSDAENNAHKMILMLQGMRDKFS